MQKNKNFFENQNKVTNTAKNNNSIQSFDKLLNPSTKILNTFSKEKKQHNKTIISKIKQAKRTGLINISNLELNYLPNEIFDDEVRFDDINWWDIVEITKIDASNNNISDQFLEMTNENKEDHINNSFLLMSFNHLPGLNFLKFSNNKFNQIPSSILSLKILKYLDFSGNKIKNIPEDIALLDSLVELNLSKNQIETVSVDFSLIKSLEILDLSSNLIYSFEANKIFPKMKKVFLQINFLSHINLWAFSQSTEINISKNRLEVVLFTSKLSNKAIVLYKNLIFLDIHNNQLQNISLPLLPRLDSLILGYNKISLIKNVNLSYSLTVFDINNNKLDTFPLEVICLQKLKTLNIQNNNINDIPSTVSLLTELVRLNIEGNPLRRINSKIRMSNAVQIKEYLKTKIENDQLNEYNTLKESSKKLILKEIVTSSDISSEEKKAFCDEFENLEKNMDKNKEINIENDKNIIEDIKYDGYFINNSLKLANLNLSAFPLQISKFSIPSMKTLQLIDISNNLLSNIVSMRNIFLQYRNDIKELDVRNNKLNSITFPKNKEMTIEETKENSLFIYNFLNMNILKVILLSNNQLEDFLEGINIDLFIKNKEIEYEKEKDKEKVKEGKYNFYTNNKNNIYNSNTNNDMDIDYELTYVNKNRVYGIFNSVEYIDISFNRLSTIPLSIEYFQNLISLIITNNNLSSIDFVFNKNNVFQHLQKLNLSSNKLEFFPNESYKYIPSLTELILDNNNLKSIPTDLCLLQLKRISLTGNPIKQIRMSIINSGCKEINDFLLKMHSFSNEEKEFYENRNNIRNRNNRIEDVSKDDCYNKYNNTIENRKENVNKNIIKNENTLIPSYILNNNSNRSFNSNQNMNKVLLNGNSLNIINERIIEIEEKMKNEKDLLKKKEFKSIHIELIKERAKIIKN